MKEEVLAIFPAIEIWGLNRKSNCTILLSDQRMIVLKEGADSPRLFARITKTQIAKKGLDALLEGHHYSLPFEKIKWVQVRPFITGTLLKVQTPGGGYRFKVGRRSSKKLEEHLRDTLGAKVRRPGEY